MPAMPLLLLAGIATGTVAYSAVAAGAAFSVGFGAARNLRGRRWAAMNAATLGCTLSAFVGCLAGEWLPVEVLLAAAAAAACAVLALLDEDLWWISLQMVIAVLVGGYFHGPLKAAALRAGAVFVGGATQVLIVMVLAKLAPRAAQPLPAGPPGKPAEKRLLIAHGLRAAICVAMALAAAEAFGLANSYWAPMTAMIVLKPGLSETRTRGMARLSGTVAGCVLATLFAIGVGYTQPWLVAGMGLAAGAAFSLQRAHYAVMTSAVTATVVLLLSLAHGGGALANAEHRLIATVLGGALALLVARIAPHRPLSRHPHADRVGAEA